MSYKDKPWKASYGKGIGELDPKEFNTTYTQAIRKTFEEVPDKAAFYFFGKETSYRELDNLSNEFANMLLENGFKKGDVLGVNIPNIPEYIIGFLGALKAGVIVS